MPRPLPMIGCDEFHWAEMLTDVAPVGTDAGEYTTDDIQKYEGLTQIGLARNVQSQGFAADNDANYATAVQDGQRTLTAGLADIPPEIYSEWFGQEYVDGMVRDGDVSSIEIWCAYRIKKANGAYRYFKYFRVKPTPSDETQDTQGQNINFNGKTCSLLASTSSFFGKWRMWIDEDDEDIVAKGITPEILREQWFTDVKFDPTDYTPVGP